MFRSACGLAGLVAASLVVAALEAAEASGGVPQLEDLVGLRGSAAETQMLARG